MVPSQTPDLKIGCVATATNDDFVIKIDAITDHSTCWQLNSFCKSSNIEKNNNKGLPRYSQFPVELYILLGKSLLGLYKCIGECLLLV